MAAAKSRLDLPADAPVKSCYEAGRECFWLHRWLVAEGISNLVVDAASIEVNRRMRRAKTDRLDATRLLVLLVRFWLGEDGVWSAAHRGSLEGSNAPTPEEVARSPCLESGARM